LFNKVVKLFTFVFLDILYEVFLGTFKYISYSCTYIHSNYKYCLLNYFWVTCDDWYSESNDKCVVDWHIN